MIVESSVAHKLLEYISIAEPKSLSLFVRSGLGRFYPLSVLRVFFEKECSFVRPLFLAVLYLLISCFYSAMDTEIVYFFLR